MFSSRQYLAQVIVWKNTCESLKIPSGIEELEEALQQHQNLIENISQTYAEVCGDGKALLDTLQTPVTSSSANSITAKADYSEAAGHVLDVVHEVGDDKTFSYFHIFSFVETIFFYMICRFSSPVNCLLIAS